jgi:hypothetical protein
MESSFDPRKPGPMSAITESSSIPYLVERSIEFLRQNPSPTSDSIKTAISLLALVRAHHEIRGIAQERIAPIKRFKNE